MEAIRKLSIIENLYWQLAVVWYTYSSYAWMHRIRSQVTFDVTSSIKFSLCFRREYKTIWNENLSSSSEVTWGLFPGTPSYCICTYTVNLHVPGPKSPMQLKILVLATRISQLVSRICHLATENFCLVASWCQHKKVNFVHCLKAWQSKLRHKTTSYK